MSDHIHTIPVDESLTPEEAWDEICFWGHRVTYTGIAGDENWATIECNDEKCYTIQENFDV